MTDIKSMTIDELKKLMTTLGDKPFRAKQIYSWLHEHLVTSYDEMTNLSKSLREKLKEYPVTALKMVDVQTSRIDGTQKYLFRLSDGNVIESVLMRYKHGNSVCISSQVGCRMGVLALRQGSDILFHCLDLLLEESNRLFDGFLAFRVKRRKNSIEPLRLRVATSCFFSWRSTVRFCFSTRIESLRSL